MDLAITPHEGDTWISPRDDRIRRPFDEATFVAADGIRYLRPELVLFMKARATVRHDDRDLATILPTLEPEQKAWLYEAIALVHPGPPLARPDSGRRRLRGCPRGRCLGSIDVAGPEVAHQLEVAGQPALVPDGQKPPPARPWSRARASFARSVAAES